VYIAQLVIRLCFFIFSTKSPEFRSSYLYTHTQYKNILQMVLHNNQKDEMQQQQQYTAGHTARE
jgi:hypothetical protein